MRSRSLVAAAAALALFAARPADAAVTVGLGADYLVDPSAGEAQLTLAVSTPLARQLSLAGRFGVMVLTEPRRVGAPIDLRLRLHLRPVYLDALVGPWIIFDDDEPFRLHAALGFGVARRNVSFGLEVGWMDPTGMVGVRVAFRL